MLYMVICCSRNNYVFLSHNYWHQMRTLVVLYFRSFSYKIKSPDIFYIVASLFDCFNDLSKILKPQQVIASWVLMSKNISQPTLLRAN